MLIGVAFFLVGCLQSLIISILISFDFMPMLENFAQQLPVQFQRLLGEEFIAQFTLKGAMAFGYNHPLVLVLLGIVAIQIPAKHVAGYIENGSMELLVSLPVKRLTFSISLILFSLSAIAVIVAGCWAGTTIGMLFFPDARILPFKDIFQIGLNLWILMVTISAYTLLISSYLNEGGRAATLAGVITIVFYFIDYISKMTEAANFLAPFTIFHYHEPLKIMAGENNYVLNVLVLAGISFIFFSLAIRKIKKRDIPG